MAKKSYNSSKADYIKISFKCDCGKVLDTGLIPVYNLRSNNKDEYPFSYELPIECSKCHKKHEIHFYDDYNISYCEIPSLTNDDSIITVHEILYEYAYHNNTMYVDFIQELSKAQHFLDDIENQNSLDKQILYRMALSYIISNMDAYLGDTFRYYVNKYDKFKERYESGRKKTNKPFRSLEKIEDQSFQNIDEIVIRYYQLAFNIELSGNQLIQNAVMKRNRIIHHNGREEDGYEIMITSSELKDILAEIESYVKVVEEKIINVVIKEIII